MTDSERMEPKISFKMDGLKLIEKKYKAVRAVLAKSKSKQGVARKSGWEAGWIAMEKLLKDDNFAWVACQTWMNWAESELIELNTSLPIKEVLTYHFALLEHIRTAIIQPNIKKYGEDIGSQAISAETMQDDDTAKGILSRVGAVVGTLMEGFQDLSKEGSFPVELHSKDWIKLLIGLLEDCLTGNFGTDEVHTGIVDVLYNIAYDTSNSSGRDLLRDENFVGFSKLGTMLYEARSTGLAIGLIKTIHILLPDKPGAMGIESRDSRSVALDKALKAHWSRETYQSLSTRLYITFKGFFSNEISDMINSMRKDDSHARPCGYLLKRLTVDAEDQMTSSRTKKELLKRRVILFVDDWGLVAELYDDEDARFSSRFHLSNIEDFGRLSGGGRAEFTFSYRSEEAQGTILPVKLTVDENHGDLLLKHMTKLNADLIAKPSDQSEGDQENEASIANSVMKSDHNDSKEGFLEYAGAAAAVAEMIEENEKSASGSRREATPTRITGKVLIPARAAISPTAEDHEATSVTQIPATVPVSQKRGNPEQSDFQTQNLVQTRSHHNHEGANLPVPAPSDSMSTGSSGELGRAGAQEVLTSKTGDLSSSSTAAQGPQKRSGDKDTPMLGTKQPPQMPRSRRGTPLDRSKAEYASAPKAGRGRESARTRQRVIQTRADNEDHDESFDAANNAVASTATVKHSSVVKAPAPKDKKLPMAGGAPALPLEVQDKEDVSASAATDALTTRASRKQGTPKSPTSRRSSPLSSCDQNARREDEMIPTEVEAERVASHTREVNIDDRQVIPVKRPTGNPQKLPEIASPENQMTPEAGANPKDIDPSEDKNVGITYPQSDILRQAVTELPPSKTQESMELLKLPYANQADHSGDRALFPADDTEVEARLGGGISQRQTTSSLEAVTDKNKSPAPSPPPQPFQQPTNRRSAIDVPVGVPSFFPLTLALSTAHEGSSPSTGGLNTGRHSPEDATTVAAAPKAEIMKAPRRSVTIQTPENPRHQRRSIADEISCESAPHRPRKSRSGHPRRDHVVDGNEKRQQGTPAQQSIVEDEVEGMEDNDDRDEAREEGEETDPRPKIELPEINGKRSGTVPRPSASRSQPSRRADNKSVPQSTTRGRAGKQFLKKHNVQKDNSDRAAINDAQVHVKPQRGVNPRGTRSATESRGLSRKRSRSPSTSASESELKVSGLSKRSRKVIRSSPKIRRGTKDDRTTDNATKAVHDLQDRDLSHWMETVMEREIDFTNELGLTSEFIGTQLRNRTLRVKSMLGESKRRLDDLAEQLVADLQTETAETINTVIENYIKVGEQYKVASEVAEKWRQDNNASEKAVDKAHQACKAAKVDWPSVVFV